MVDNQYILFEFYPATMQNLVKIVLANYEKINGEHKFYNQKLAFEVTFTNINFTIGE